MNEEIHKVQFILPPTPSAKDQLKEATVATVIGLVPLAAMAGGLYGWAWWANRRDEKKRLKENPVVEETPDE